MVGAGAWYLLQQKDRLQEKQISELWSKYNSLHAELGEAKLEIAYLKAKVSK